MGNSNESIYYIQQDLPNHRRSIWFLSWPTYLIRARKRIHITIYIKQQSLITYDTEMMHHLFCCCLLDIYISVSWFVQTESLMPSLFVPAIDIDKSWESCKHGVIARSSRKSLVANGTVDGKVWAPHVLRGPSLLGNSVPTLHLGCSSVVPP